MAKKSTKAATKKSAATLHSGRNSAKTEIKEIFELNKVADDPRFEGFALSETPSILGRDSLDDDLDAGFADADTNINWQQPQLLSRWVTPKVIGRVSEFNDYPCVDLLLPAFSERAVEKLRPLLAPNGELLPLKSKTKTRFFLYNILTISDALDRKRSKSDSWLDPPTRAISIDYFEFHRNRLEGLSIFRIREYPVGVFVTNEFMDRVNFFGLKGFSFTKVWPLPVGVNYRMQTVESERKQKNQLKKQTLIVVFPFNGSPKQKKSISAFEDVCDQRLQITDLTQTYLGSYEGHDQVEHEYRMFFSTPNADKLFNLLHDDIQKLKWPEPIKVYRRKGRMYDEKAKEEMSEV
jgi:hypothetical protein